MKLDEIPPLENSALIEIHEINRAAVRNPTVHILLKEIARLRQVVRTINSDFESMRTVWQEEIGGYTVGMNQMRRILATEMRIYGLPEDPRRVANKERMLQTHDEKRFLENVKVLDGVRKEGR